MTADDLKSIGEVAAFLLLGGYTAWKSHKAAKQTVATGNGFAKFVKEHLTEIKDQVGRTEKKIDDHIASHADADVHRGRK